MEANVRAFLVAEFSRIGRSRKLPGEGAKSGAARCWTHGRAMSGRRPRVR